MIEQLKPGDLGYGDVQVTPDVSSDDMQHVLDTTCWCQPGVETDVASGGRVVIHRRYLDGPLYQLPEPDWNIIGVSSAAGWSYPKELRRREQDHVEWHRNNPGRKCEAVA